MDAQLNKLPMAKPIHPSIHVGLTGGGAYHRCLQSHLAPYLFALGRINYQQGQVWYIHPIENEPLPASAPFLWPTLCPTSKPRHHVPLGRRTY